MVFHRLVGLEHVGLDLASLSGAVLFAYQIAEFLIVNILPKLICLRTEHLFLMTVLLQ